MQIRNPLRLLWMSCVICAHVQANIGDVSIGLQYQLRQCLSKSRSLNSAIVQELACLKSSAFRCLLFHEPNNRHHEVTELLCGVINSGQPLELYTWLIAVPNRYSLYIDFLHFHLPSSPHCKSVATVSVESIRPLSQNSMYIYCGNRMPWYISFPHSHAIVQCRDKYITPKGFHFVMTFQAFDITLPSVSLVQWNELELHSKEFTFANLGIGQPLSVLPPPFYEVEIQLHIVINVYNHIELRYSRSVFPNIKIYDGPGPLSPIISVRTTRVYLSSYQGFVKYSSALIRNSKTDAYEYANNHSCCNSQHLNWRSNFEIINQVKISSRDKANANSKVCPQISKNIRGTSARCWLQKRDTSMTIHEMTFIGINMLRHSPPSRIPTCQYGGLFVVWVNHKPDDHPHNYITICSNVSHKTVFPINDTLNDGLTESLLLLFITFEGYSNGFVDITMATDEECFGSDVAISTDPFGSNILSNWTDQSINVMDRKITLCTDVWLLNEIDIFDSVPFQNYTFTLDHTQLGFPVAKYKMIIYSCFIYRSDFFMDSTATVPLEMNAFISLQTKLDTAKFNFSVPFSMRNEYIFDSPIYTTFKIMLLVYDKFPTFAIRLQFIENRICSALNLIDFWANIHTFGNDIIHKIGDNISDVYLSPHHPYDQLSSIIHYYEGYDHGTCRMIVTKHK